VRSKNSGSTFRTSSAMDRKADTPPATATGYRRPHSIQRFGQPLEGQPRGRFVESESQLGAGKRHPATAHQRDPGAAGRAGQSGRVEEHERLGRRLSQPRHGLALRQALAWARACAARYRWPLPELRVGARAHPRHILQRVEIARSQQHVAGIDPRAPAAAPSPASDCSTSAPCPERNARPCGFSTFFSSATASSSTCAPSSGSGPICTRSARGSGSRLSVKVSLTMVCTRVCPRTGHKRPQLDDAGPAVLAQQPPQPVAHLLREQAPRRQRRHANLSRPASATTAAGSLFGKFQRLAFLWFALPLRRPGQQPGEGNRAEE